MGERWGQVNSESIFVLDAGVPPRFLSIQMWSRHHTEVLPFLGPPEIRVSGLLPTAGW